MTVKELIEKSNSLYFKIIANDETKYIVDYNGDTIREKNIFERFTELPIEIIETPVESFQIDNKCRITIYL